MLKKTKQNKDKNKKSSVREQSLAFIHRFASWAQKKKHKTQKQQYALASKLSHLLPTFLLLRDRGGNKSPQGGDDQYRAPPDGVTADPSTAKAATVGDEMEFNMDALDLSDMKVWGGPVNTLDPFDMKIQGGPLNPLHFFDMKVWGRSFFDTGVRDGSLIPSDLPTWAGISSLNPP